MLKRHITCIISFLMVLVFVMAIGVGATETPAEDHNYVRFLPLTRMDSDGSFTFDFHYSCPSDKFTANSTSISINTCAKIYHMSDPSNVFTDSSQAFELILYKQNLIGTTEVGRYTGYADGIYGGRTFSGLTVGATYYFIMNPVDVNFDMTGDYFTGYGDVSNITVN